MGGLGWRAHGRRHGLSWRDMATEVGCQVQASIGTSAAAGPRRAADLLGLVAVVCGLANTDYGSGCRHKVRRCMWAVRVAVTQARRPADNSCTRTWLLTPKYCSPPHPLRARSPPSDSYLYPYPHPYPYPYPCPYPHPSLLVLSLPSPLPRAETRLPSDARTCLGALLALFSHPPSQLQLTPAPHHPIQRTGPRAVIIVADTVPVEPPPVHHTLPIRRQEQRQAHSVVLRIRTSNCTPAEGTHVPHPSCAPARPTKVDFAANDSLVPLTSFALATPNISRVQREPASFDSHH